MKKILAFTLTLCLLLGAVPVLASSAQAAELTEISYENDFNLGDTVGDLGDFYTYYRAGGDVLNDGLFTWQKLPTGYLTTTVPGTDGAVGRLSIDTASGWATDRDPYRNLVNNTLLSQQYTDLELTATIRLSAGGASCMGFIIGQTTLGDAFCSNKRSGGGTGVMFKRLGNTRMALAVLNLGDYYSAGEWKTTASYVVDNSTMDSQYGVTTTTPMNVKLAVKDSVLNVYIQHAESEDWIPFAENIPLRNYELGYVSMSQSVAQVGGATKAIDQYFDNLSIRGTGVERTATAGSSVISYTNTFDDLTIMNVLDDFRLLYTLDCHNTDTKYYPIIDPTEIYSHFYTQNNRIYLQQATGTQGWYEMYYATSLLQYTRSQFNDLTLELDYNNASAGPNHTLIQIGATDAYQSAYNPDGSGGYLIGLKRTGNQTAELYLAHKGASRKITTFGSAAGVGVTVTGYGTDITTSTVRVTVENKVLKVEMRDNTDAYVTLHEETLDEYETGYVAFGSDYGASNSFYDRFSITGPTAEPQVLYTASSIVFTPVAGYEYSIDGEHYSSETVYLNLDTDTPYNVSQRVAAVDRLAASEAASVSITPSASGNGYGDVNGDARIDSTDLAAVRRVLLGVGEEVRVEAAVDAHVDGQNDIRDLIAIKKKMIA